MKVFSDFIIDKFEVIVETNQIKSDFYRELGNIFTNNEQIYLSLVLITNSGSNIYSLTVKNAYYEQVKDLEDYLYGYQLGWEKNHE